MSQITGDGQIITSPNPGIGNVVLSLGTTITNNEVFSSSLNVTGTFEIGGNSLSLGGNTTLPAAPGSTQCLQIDNTGAITATGSGCGGTTIAIGTTLTGGASGNILYDNAGTLGELTPTGTGNPVLATSPTLVTPALGAATATTLAVGGATLGGDAVAVTGSGSFSGGVTAASLTLSGLATGLSTCVNPSDGCPKSYIDQLATGQTVIHTPVTATTTAAAPTPNSPTYDNGTAGVGATLTDGTTGSVLVVDGITISTIGTRVGITDLTFQNGIFTLTTAGVAGVTKWVLTRATDFDQAATGEIALGAQFSAVFGTLNANKNFWMNQVAAITVGTTAITFAQNPGCSIFTPSTPGCVPSPAGADATHYLDATGHWTIPAGGSGSVTSVGLSAPATSIFAVTGTPITSSGTLGLTTTGTSGGIPYFSSSSVVKSSGALTNHALVLGGGAGATPTSLGLGTTTTLLHGNAAGAPTYAAVALGTDVSGNLPLANMASIATKTVLGNATGGTAVPTALSQTQLTALVNPFTTALSGAVPASGGATGSKFLSDAGTWLPGTSAPTLSVCTTQTASYALNYAGSSACAAGSDVNGVIPFNPSGASVVFTVPQSTATIFPPGTGASVNDIVTATNPITACLATGATWSAATTAPIASNALCPASGNGITIQHGQTVQFVTDASNNWVSILTSNLDPTVANTWSGAQTFGAPVAVTSTTLAAPAAGSLALGGTASDPTLAANAEGACFLSATNGLRCGGYGSTFDFSLFNMETGTPTTLFSIPHTGAYVTANNGLTIGSTAQISANDKLSVSSSVTNKGASFQNTATAGYLPIRLYNNGGNAVTWTLNGSTDTTDNCAAANCFQMALGSSGYYITGLGADTGKTDATVCRVTTGGQILTGTGTLGICLGTSSARFKDAITTEVGGLRSAMHLTFGFMELRPIEFQYRPGMGYDPAHTYNGFLAEDVAQVWPDLVGKDAKGRPNTVDMFGMVPRIVAQVQIQQLEIGGLIAWNLLLTIGLIFVWRRKHA